MRFRSFYFTAAAVLVAGGLLAACGGQTELREVAKESTSQVTVQQDWGSVAYWIEPGPRRLDSEVFGTPQDPKFTLKEKLAQGEEMGLPGPIMDLMRDLPPLVSAPMPARETSGGEFTMFTQPTIFSDNAVPLGFSEDDGARLEATLTDRVESDIPEEPFNTHDEVEMDLEFHDPDGNHYRVEMTRLVQPPLPGYETGNGVVLDRDLHGVTGTGTPLMPSEYTHAAFWGFGDLYVNGERRANRLVHLMTTEVVRNEEYELVFDGDLPLSSDERHIEDQTHHTHVVILPIETYKPMPMMGPLLGIGPTAPRHAPVPTEYELPNGQTQKAIHIMFEEDEITNTQNVNLDHMP